MSSPSTSPRLLVPALAGFYRRAEPLSYLAIRVTAGLMLVPHGWPKLMGGADRFTAGLARRGFEPEWLWSSLVIFLETAGGLLIALGLFTRPFAAAVAVQMAVITFAVHWSDGRHELPLMWGLVMLAIALRGGGPYSLDRRLGWEI